MPEETKAPVINEQQVAELIDDQTAGADDMDMITSWYSLNNQDYFLAYTTIPHVPTGLYNIIYSQEFGMGLAKVQYTVDDIYLLPGTPFTEIVNDLAAFWNSTEKFKAFKLKPHRGILLYGETGCGKTSLIYKILEEIKVFDGIVIQFNDPIPWLNMAPIIRRLENDRPIICVIENLDKVLDKFGEEPFLAFLDGMSSIHNVVYIATTNNIDAIPDRIKNRPSRFDRKYEITKPIDNARREYFKKKLAGVKVKKYKLDKLVADTDGFTMAHLREFFVSVFIFNNKYEETLTMLRNSKNPNFHPKFFGRKDD